MSESEADSKERFTSRVHDYVRARPGYPADVIAALRDECGFTPQSIVADVGSGTGLLTKLLLKNGNEVYGVEPNDAMRAAGEEFLNAYPRFHSIYGTAEDTKLKTATVDLVTAGQAFHWFAPAAARREFARILRPGGWVAIVWNERLKNSTPFLRAYEDLLKTFSSDYGSVAEKWPTPRALREFFSPQTYAEKSFPNPHDMDYEGARARLLSSSYAPAEGHPKHEPMIEELKRIVEAHAENGQVRFDYTTHVYYGRLA
jgi:SAM-dependent methyltransferase